MAKVKRYIMEYANSKIRLYDKLAKEYPHNRDDFNRGIRNCDKAIWNVEHGYITEDDAIRLILESLER